MEESTRPSRVSNELIRSRKYESMTFTSEGLPAQRRDCSLEGGSVNGAAPAPLHVYIYRHMPVYESAAG